METTNEETLIHETELDGMIVITTWCARKLDAYYRENTYRGYGADLARTFAGGIEKYRVVGYFPKGANIAGLRKDLGRYWQDGSMKAGR